MENIKADLLAGAMALESVFDEIFPLSQITVENTHPSKFKITHKLLNQLLDIALSLIKLAKVENSFKAKAIEENRHSILALSRVLAECSNKFFYLAIDPENDTERQLRWSYFSFAGRVKYKKLLLSVDNLKDDPERDLIYARIDKAIVKDKKYLYDSGFESWQAYLNLASNPKQQRRFAEGNASEDYPKADFDSAVARRLHPNERLHYKDIGNVAVHSSAFLLLFRETDGDHLSMVGSVACIVLFNTARHLALCGMEILSAFPELENLVGSKIKVGWGVLADRLKNENYAYT